jgi:NADH dehydrogenase FAD-containing subunit
VEAIHPEINAVVLSTKHGSRTLNYDYLILSAGPAFQEADIPVANNAFKVASATHIRQLEDHIVTLCKTDFREKGASTFVVVGSDLAGLETATGLEQKARTIQAYQSGKNSRFKVILLQYNNVIAAGNVAHISAFGENIL